MITIHIIKKYSLDLKGNVTVMYDTHISMFLVFILHKKMFKIRFLATEKSPKGEQSRIRPGLLVAFV